MLAPQDAASSPIRTSRSKALLASACLLQLLRAVDIDGEPYWDGALTGNPALGPLLTKRPDCDLIIVRVDPVNRVRKRRVAYATS